MNIDTDATDQILRTYKQLRIQGPLSRTHARPLIPISGKKREVDPPSVPAWSSPQQPLFGDPPAMYLNLT